MAAVNQYRLIFANRWSRLNTVSMSPPQSDQARNFSTIQAAKPAGESVSAKASVCGRVPWIHWYPVSSLSQTWSSSRCSSGVRAPPQPLVDPREAVLGHGDDLRRLGCDGDGL